MSELNQRHFHLIAGLSTAQNLDLRRLDGFICRGFELLEDLLGEHAQWYLRTEIPPGWLKEMRRHFSEHEFQAGALLFELHRSALFDHYQQHGYGRECHLVNYMGDAIHPHLTERDQMAIKCHLTALAVTWTQADGGFWLGNRKSWFWQDFDSPVATDLLKPLCLQIVRHQVSMLPDGTYSPDDTPPATPRRVQLQQWPKELHKWPDREVRGYLASALSDLLVGAMAHHWVTAEEAENVFKLDPCLEPWWLLQLSDDECRGIPGALPEFWLGLRQRFPAALDALLDSADSSPAPVFGSLFWSSTIAGEAFLKVAGLDNDALLWRSSPLRGSTGLLAAARWVSKYPKRLHKRPSDSWTLLIDQLANVKGLYSDESTESVVSALRKFSRQTLAEVLPSAGTLQPQVLQAMGLESLETFRRWMIDALQINVAHTQASGGNSGIDFLRNDPDPRQGMLDLAGFRAALQGAPFKDVYALIETYRKAGKGTGIDKVLAAVTGEADRAQLLQAAVNKLQQPAMKLLGLLPAADADDIRLRYLTLQQLVKDASKHGAQRQATQRAAALAGLANLAQVAGYRDGGELEWVMESGEGPAVLASFTPQQIGDCEAWIRLDGFAAELQFRNSSGKVLTSAPAGIKRESALATLKAKLAEIREQFRRFGRLMETRMVSGAPFAISQLHAALPHPIMAPIICGLAWQDEAGAIGLFCADGLIGPEGTVAVTGNAVRLVHPVFLLQRPDGQALLSRWQRWVFEQRRMQPFKQLFREIHVPTPAELETEGHFQSSRYAGRRIQTGIAQGLFQARGWVLFNEDECWSLALGNGLSASCGYAVGHYFTEQPEGELLDVVFARHGEPLSLLDVPPTMFSETMRDLDLIVTIAMPDASDESHEIFTSSAALAARTELLRAIAPSLGDNILEFHDRYVLVHGKLGNYRVHLASGHVYLEPGAYVHIIPASTTGQSPVCLPFAEQDLKTEEIISKVILLVHDDRIKDQNLSRQIRRPQG